MSKRKQVKEPHPPEHPQRGPYKHHSKVDDFYMMGLPPPPADARVAELTKGATAQPKAASKAEHMKKTEELGHESESRSRRGSPVRSCRSMRRRRLVSEIPKVPKNRTQMDSRDSELAHRHGEP